MKDQNKTSRRQWFAAMTRWSIAAALTGVSLKLLSGKGTDEPSCADPRGRIGCRNCSALPKCGLPKALSVKQFLSRKDV